MAKSTRQQVEVEAISDDEGEVGEVSQSRPVAPATNVAAARRTAPATNAAARKPLAPATNAAALGVDEAIATPTSEQPTPAVEQVDDNATVPVSFTPPAPRKAARPTASAVSGATVRPAPASVTAKSSGQRSAVASGQARPRPKQQVKKSNNLGLFVAGGVALLAVVLLVVAVVMNGGKQGAVLAPATPDLPTQAPLAQNSPVANNSGIIVPTIADPQSTESANYGQTPQCNNWAAKVNNEVIRCDIYLAYAQSKDQVYKDQYGTLLNFNSPPGRRALEVLHEDALDELIDQEVAALEAPKEGVTTPSSLLDQQMAQLRGSKTDQQWQDFLKQQGMTEADERHLLDKGYLVQQMTKQHGTAPSQDLWLKVAHILIASNNPTLANNIYQQIQGGADFTALAQQYSIDPLTKDKGGLLGFVNPNSIDQASGDALKLLKDGETAKPLGTRKGWEILHVISRELRPVADPASIADQSQSDFQNWVRPLWKNYTIVKNVTFLPTITPDMSKIPPTYTPDPARGTPFGLTGLNGNLATPIETQGP